MAPETGLLGQKLLKNDAKMPNSNARESGRTKVSGSVGGNAYSATQNKTECGWDARTLPPADFDANGVSNEEKKKQDEKKAMHDSKGYVGGMFEVENGLNNIQAPEWITIEVVMDSGAAESVAPADMAPWVPIKESEGSRAGKQYLSASGEMLKNLGEKKVEVYTNEGHARARHLPGGRRD